MIDSFRSRSRKTQRTGLLVLNDKRRQSWFVDGDDALFKCRDLYWIDVYTDDIVTSIRQAGSRYNADLAGTEHGKFHCLILS